MHATGEENEAPQGHKRSARGIFVRFVVSGGCSALTFFGLCFAFARIGLSPLIGSMLAYAIAFGLAYTLQHRWTFGAQHRHAAALPRYFVLQVGCALLSGLISQTAVSVFALPALTMALSTTIVAGGTSFILSRYWVFPHARSSAK